MCSGIDETEGKGCKAKGTQGKRDSKEPPLINSQTPHASCAVDPQTDGIGRRNEDLSRAQNATLVVMFRVEGIVRSLGVSTGVASGHLHHQQHRLRAYPPADQSRDCSPITHFASAGREEEAAASAG